MPVKPFVETSKEVLEHTFQPVRNVINMYSVKDEEPE